jgi:hypothetical protein
MSLDGRYSLILSSVGSSTTTCCPNESFPTIQQQMVEKTLHLYKGAHKATPNKGEMSLNANVYMCDQGLIFKIRAHNYESFESGPLDKDQSSSHPSGPLK